MVGSVLMAFLGGMYYWWPKIWGRMYSERWGQIGFFIVFLGFNLTFFPQFVAGSHGMPRRYASYPQQFTRHHRVSSAGAYVMGAGMFLVLGNWIHSLRRGKPAPSNPFGGTTLEWRAPSPPPHDNFKVSPEAGDPYDMRGWYENPETGNWELDESKRKEPTEGHA
jgi:cytochrome c oxidase subunit 1